MAGEMRLMGSQRRDLGTVEQAANCSQAGTQADVGRIGLRINSSGSLLAVTA